MLPIKDMDFNEDMYKLFSRRTSNDGDSLPSTSPFHTGNRSSSSADSISPEAYFNIYITETPRHFDLPSREQSNQDVTNILDRPFDNFSLDHQNSNCLVDSPTSSLNTFQGRHPRPIVGRRILGSNNSTKNERDIQIDNQKNYELFPIKNKGFEFYTQTKTNNNNYNMNNISPPENNSFSMPHTNKNFQQFSKPISTPCLSKEEFGTKMCTFCRKNGETKMVYMTHCVKEKIGNKHIVTCPILRLLECKTCGASGDNAHTLTYCPVILSSNNGKPIQSTTVTLKNTRIKSNGKRRY